MTTYTWPHWHVFTARSDGIDRCCVCDQPRIEVEVTIRQNLREGA